MVVRGTGEKSAKAAFMLGCKGGGVPALAAIEMWRSAELAFSLAFCRPCNGGGSCKHEIFWNFASIYFKIAGVSYYQVMALASSVKVKFSTVTISSTS